VCSKNGIGNNGTGINSTNDNVGKNSTFSILGFWRGWGFGMGGLGLKMGV